MTRLGSEGDAVRGRTTAKLHGHRITFEWDENGPVHPLDPHLAEAMAALEGQAIVYMPSISSMLMHPANWKSYIALLMAEGRLTTYEGPSIIPPPPPGVVG
jgi:hypothetical protein